ncbi:glycosyltransferase family 2 protein [Collinsella sp. AGMB00827]|uniref:Glycosyltransferase family 2 protein n=2 Tax=Collinsella ureilytica TaxID=2869515 RepID=A0ABS7MI28_9ACTN|nr:glycosyltransferase family 2 protein [Collinsella urealyticum]
MSENLTEHEGLDQQKPAERDVTVSFGIPSYNAAKDLDRCVASILDGADGAQDIEVIIVDDGSQDETPALADSWAARHPDIVRVVHQENGGHGMAVLAGLREARGTYYKVVDSDDWLNAEALASMLKALRSFIATGERVDLFISNYVYEKVHEGTHTTIGYKSALPQNRVFGWEEVGRFLPSQNLIMHSLCYRTDVLRRAPLPMPAHTFYVDNIYAYVPLPRCLTMYYADIDLYRYYIGREGQSVNETTMIGRLDQQFRITRIMMDAYRLYEDISEPHLRRYMMGYFTMMMAICSVFTKLSDDPEKPRQLRRLWADLKEHDPAMYRRARYGVVGLGTNLPTRLGERATIGLYHLAGKIVKFN